VLFVSFSGQTPELINVLQHIPDSTQLMALSSHAHPDHCPLLAAREDSILLPTPIPEKEELSFGVSAPTTSTTVTLAVADMLALTIAEQMHRSRKKEVFARNHPGGAIGITHREVQATMKAKVNMELLELPSPSISGSDDA
jgi:D-arabinose 5-phosphate isomerase GutQ